VRIASLAVAALAACATGAHAGPLYRVDRPGVAPSYLFGTLHSSDPRVTELAPTVRDALARSRRLAPELVMGEGDLPDFIAGASYDDARRLADHFDAATLDAIRASLGPLMPDEATFARLKPWAVMLLLARPHDDERATLDAVVVDAARRRGMTIVGLELPEEQVASLDAIPLASQVALVRFALAHRGDREREHEATVRAFVARDLRRLRAIALEAARGDAAMRAHVQALLRHLVDDRSALMAHRLFLPLRDGRVFVAVGALHLDGPKGLVALIRAQGYRVTRLRRRRRPALLAPVEQSNVRRRGLRCCLRRSNGRVSAAATTRIHRRRARVAMLEWRAPRWTSRAFATTTSASRSTRPTSTRTRIVSSSAGSARRSRPRCPSPTR
jgi:uncharacterized protein YbaP (TraB family)